jgi:hypothetical protein
MLLGGTYTSDEEELLRELEENADDDGKGSQPPSTAERGLSFGWKSEAVSHDEAKSRLSALLGPSGSGVVQAVAASSSDVRGLGEPPPVNKSASVSKFPAPKQAGISAFFNGLIGIGKKKSSGDFPPTAQQHRGISDSTQNDARPSQNRQAILKVVPSEPHDSSSLETWSFRDAEEFLQGMQGSKQGSASSRPGLEDVSWDLAEAERLLSESSHVRHGKGEKSSASRSGPKLRDQDIIKEEDELMVPSYARDVIDFTAVRLPSRRGDASRDMSDSLFEPSYTREDQAKQHHDSQPAQTRPAYLLGLEPSSQQKRHSNAGKIGQGVVDKQSYLLGRETSRPSTHHKENSSPRPPVEVVEFGVARKQSASAATLSADLVKSRLEVLAARFEFQNKGDSITGSRTGNNSSDVSQLPSPIRTEEGDEPGRLVSPALKEVPKLPLPSDFGMKNNVSGFNSNNNHVPAAVGLRPGSASKLAPSNSFPTAPHEPQITAAGLSKKLPNPLEVSPCPPAEPPHIHHTHGSGGLASVQARRPLPPSINKRLEPNQPLPGGLVPRPPTTSKKGSSNRHAGELAPTGSRSPGDDASSGDDKLAANAPHGSSIGAVRSPHARRFKDVALSRPIGSLSGANDAGNYAVIAPPEREDEADELFARMKRNALLRWWRAEVCLSRFPVALCAIVTRCFCVYL